MSTVPLGGVLGALNHLIAAVLEEYAASHGRSVVSFDNIQIDEHACRIAGNLRTSEGLDRFVIRLDVASPAGSRQSLRVNVEQWPAHLPLLVTWLKPLLDSARIDVDLDFDKWLAPQAADG